MAEYFVHVFVCLSARPPLPPFSPPALSIFAEENVKTKKKKSHNIDDLETLMLFESSFVMWAHSVLQPISSVLASTPSILLWRILLWIKRLTSSYLNPLPAKGRGVQ